MGRRKIGITAAAASVAGVAVAGVLVNGGIAFAGPPTASPTTSPSSAAGATPSDSSAAARGQRGPKHEHTAVTGDEAAKVTAAVKAKDSSLTVDSVRKDPDGSYDASATKDGTRIMVEVSADLATITQRAQPNR